MKPGQVVPAPEGVSHGAPAVGREGAHTPPPAGLLRHFRVIEGIRATSRHPLGGRSMVVISETPEDAMYQASRTWITHEPLRAIDDEAHRQYGAGILNWAEASPLPDEAPSEHIKNALQLLYELEALLLEAQRSLTGGIYSQQQRALMADVKRRLGWALRGLAPHAL